MDLFLYTFFLKPGKHFQRKENAHKTLCGVVIYSIFGMKKEKETTFIFKNPNKTKTGQHLYTFLMG